MWRRKSSGLELPEGLTGAVELVTFHILTIFPEFFHGPFEHGIIQRARESGLIEIQVHDLRQLDRRPAPDGGRPAVRRRRGHGAEGGPDV